MRRLRGLCSAAALIAAAIGGCSKTPTFVDDRATATGAGGASTTTTTTGTATASGGAGGATATGAPCQVATDCPGAETECAHRACVAGHCAMQYAPVGFALATQTSGDCKAAVCDGEGGSTTADDDGDVPADGNPCTIDRCEAGTPKHEAAAKGTPCGAAGKLACDDQGTCAGCAKSEDCGASSACASFACNEATTRCEITYVPAGEGDPGAQQAGDCKKNVCNGAGGTSTVTDDGDVPDDGNPCTTDACAAGQPSHGFTPPGSACGAAGATCDGKGACSGCSKDADCGQSSACATYACAGGACSVSYVPYGQGSAGQPVGACKRSVCDGNGSPTAIADDANLPVDGNACTQDVCAGGVPSNPPVPAGTGCGGALKCDGAGGCKGCTSDADCGASSACAHPRCQGGTCGVEYEPAGASCGLPLQLCNGAGACTCADPNACAGRCGALTNGCGEQVDCGDPCGAPQSCGGGGQANVCGCSDPNACSGKCGPITDACGAGRDCGNPCSAPQTCGGGGQPNQCGCADPGACDGKCGTIVDACGVQRGCGDPCVAPQSCGGGGQPNVCGCTPEADPCGTLGYDCGTAPDGCGGTVACPDCLPNEYCKFHVCMCSGPCQ